MNFLKGRYCFQWKMGFVKTLIHLKTPPPRFWVQFIEPWEGYPTAILSLSIGMYIYLFHVYICIVSYSLYNYVCVSADCSIGKGNSAILLHFITLRKECVFVRQSKWKRKTKLIVKTYSGFNRLDADQGDQLIEQLRRCGASIPLLCCREGLCCCFFELSSASCWEQA